MTTDIGLVLAAAIGLFSLVLSARALLQPDPAARGFGVAPTPGVAPYMAIKGGRDLTVGLIVLALLVTSSHRALGTAVLAATAIPVIDGIIVQRIGGPKAVTYGVHFSTAVIMLAAAVLLLTG